MRFIDAFVEKLDLRALGFGKAVAADTGRPPYDPGVGPTNNLVSGCIVTNANPWANISF